MAGWCWRCCSCSTPGAQEVPGENISALPGEQRCPHTPPSSWVMLKPFPAPPVLYPFPKAGINHFSPINIGESLSFVQSSLPSKRKLPQVSTQTGLDCTDPSLQHSQGQDESGQNPIRFHFLRSSLILIPLLRSCHSNFISCNKDARLIYRRVIGDRIRSSRQANQSQSKTPE